MCLSASIKDSYAAAKDAMYGPSLSCSDQAAGFEASDFELPLYEAKTSQNHRTVIRVIPAARRYRVRPLYWRRLGHLTKLFCNELNIMRHLQALSLAEKGKVVLRGGENPVQRPKGLRGVGRRFKGHGPSKLRISSVLAELQNTNVSQTNGKTTNGTDGTHANGHEADGTRTGGIYINGSHVNRANGSGTRNKGTQTDGILTNGTHTHGTLSKGHLPSGLSGYDRLSNVIYSTFDDGSQVEEEVEELADLGILPGQAHLRHMHNAVRKTGLKRGRSSAHLSKVHFHYSVNRKLVKGLALLRKERERVEDLLEMNIDALIKLGIPITSAQKDVSTQTAFTVPPRDEEYVLGGNTTSKTQPSIGGWFSRLLKRKSPPCDDRNALQLRGGGEEDTEWTSVQEQLPLRKTTPLHKYEPNPRSPLRFSASVDDEPSSGIIESPESQTVVRSIESDDEPPRRMKPANAIKSPDIRKWMHKQELGRRLKIGEAEANMRGYLVTPNSALLAKKYLGTHDVVGAYIAAWDELDDEAFDALLDVEDDVSDISNISNNAEPAAAPSAGDSGYSSAHSGPQDTDAMVAEMLRRLKQVAATMEEAERAVPPTPKQQPRPRLSLTIPEERDTPKSPEKRDAPGNDSPVDDPRKEKKVRFAEGTKGEDDPTTADLSLRGGEQPPDTAMRVNFAPGTESGTGRRGRSPPPPCDYPTGMELAQLMVRSHRVVESVILVCQETGIQPTEDSIIRLLTGQSLERLAYRGRMEQIEEECEDIDLFQRETPIAIAKPLQASLEPSKTPDGKLVPQTHVGGQICLKAPVSYAMPKERAAEIRARQKHTPCTVVTAPILDEHGHESIVRFVDTTTPLGPRGHRLKRLFKAILPSLAH